MKRQEPSRPILDAFWSWVEETSCLYTTNEKLTTTLTYTKNQSPRKYDVSIIQSWDCFCTTSCFEPLTE